MTAFGLIALPSTGPEMPLLTTQKINARLLWKTQSMHAATGKSKRSKHVIEQCDPTYANRDREPVRVLKLH